MPEDTVNTVKDYIKVLKCLVNYDASNTCEDDDQAYTAGYHSNSLGNSTEAIAAQGALACSTSCLLAHSPRCAPIHPLDVATTQSAPIMRQLWLQQAKGGQEHQLPTLHCMEAGKPTPVQGACQIVYLE